MRCVGGMYREFEDIGRRVSAIGFADSVRLVFVNKGRSHYNERKDCVGLYGVQAEKL